jgi:hypothetical protein
MKMPSCRTRRSDRPAVAAIGAPYSAFAPDAFTTFAHLSVSAARCAPNAAGVASIGVLPRSAMRARMSGFASPALISRLSVAIDGAELPCRSPRYPV